jgi:hypothetical protein
VIHRRLSVPPERRILRLPHTVGQVRLVGVPFTRCCIWDTFTAPDGTLLSEHKPDVGGPWIIQDTWSYYGAVPRAPIIEAGEALALGASEGYGWATAWADCGPAVRIEADWTIYRIAYDEASIMLWWSGETVLDGSLGGKDGISLTIFESGGLYYQLRYPSAADPLVMATTSPVLILSADSNFQMSLEMRGKVAHWGIRASDWEASGAVPTGAVPRPGVGFRSDGFRFDPYSYAAGVTEFRACPL